MNPSSPVLAPLASLAKARRRHSRGIAVAGILAVVVAAAGILALLDTWLEWHPPVRIALVAVAATTFLVVLVKRLRLAKRHDPMEAARLIEQANPEIGQKLRTALEISQQAPKPGNPDADFFTDRLMRETGKELTLTPWSRLVPTKELWTKRAAMIAAIAMLAVVATMWGDFRHALKRIALPHQDLTYTTVAWKSLPNGFDEKHPPRVEFEVRGRAAQPELLLRQGSGEWKPVELTRRADGRTWDVVFTGKTKDIEVKVKAGDAKVEEKTIAFRPIPKLIESKATMAFPEYTGMKPETVPGGDVRCVEGSTATWDFTFNTQPDRITWRVGGSEPLDLSPQPGTAKFSAASEVKVGKAQGELAIFHADGVRIDAWRFEIEGVVDKLPVVEILEPAKDLELISTAEMPIRIRAKDDFGVAEIGLILDAGGERRWMLETVIDEKNQRQVSEIASMMLDQIPLKITDNVRIHAYALDHKPRGGPRAVSPLRSVDIRQFQMRWYYAGGGDGGGEEEEEQNNEAVTDALMKLDEIIGAQRGILSDVFGMKESYRSKLPLEAMQKAMELAQREGVLAAKTELVAQDWEASGDLPADDIALMATAGVQMLEAAGFLETPDLVKGFSTADRALSTLLQLRKELVTIIGKGKKPSEPKDKPPVPLTELAKEARRIAGEEKDVAGQIAPEAIAGNNVEATRRQQEVALADTGELYANLVDHAERNDGALRLMDDSEKAVAKADKTLNTETPANASPELGVAERDLLDLATFLEAMDLQKLSDTLRKMADNAEKAAEGQKKPGEGKSEGQGEGKSPGQGEAAAEAAKATELTKKILEELAKKAGATQPDLEAEKPPTAAALEDLQKRTDAAGLAKDLEKLAQLQKDGAKEAEGLGADAAQRLGEMARELRDAAAGLDASRIAELNKAREQAEALKKELAQQGAGQKPGEKGKGRGEGQKPGENGKGAVASKEGEGKKPGEAGKGEGEGNKPGEGGKGEMASKDGKGEGEGDKPGENGKGQGDKPGKDGQGGGDKPGLGGPALGRFADTLDRLRDEGGVGRMVMPLRAAPFDRSTIPLVDAADQRLQELIDRIPTDPGMASARGKLPEESRREIEDYFRDLSDDFGGEVWETKQ